MSRLTPAQLTARHIQFVDEYVKDQNAAAAFARAFPHVSAGTAKTSGANMRKRPEVQAMIAERMKGMLKLADITLERVLIELGRRAFFDPRKVVRPGLPTSVTADDGKVSLFAEDEPIPLSQLDEDTARSVTEIEYTRGRGTKIRFADKDGALHQLLRILSPAPHMRNPQSPTQGVANLVDHETLDDSEIEALIAETVDAEATEDDIVDMGEDGEMVDDEGDDV